jgi:hypothetical protein
VDKLISSFAASLDLSKTKVKQGPAKITVFGGKTEQQDDGSLSQRGTFLLTPGELVDGLVVPEHFKNWNHFGIYNDLLSFEEDVCALVDTVLVFLESAGSIAEFAVFIKNREIAPKLLVVFNGQEDADSFIQLGLIRYLESKYPNAIPVINSRGPGLSLEEAKFIVEESLKRSENSPKLPAFNVSSPRHWMYLIVDFVDLMQVARISDIQFFLKSVGFTQNKKRIEQMLLALKNVSLLIETRVLSERCFSLRTATNLIEYSFRPETTAKRVSWKAKLFVEINDDKWRLYAYRQLKLVVNEGMANVA